MPLNQSERPTGRHYTILAMAWAGWAFDFYDLMLFSFLLVPIKKSLGFSDAQLSLLLGVSLAFTAIGGLVFGWLADRLGRKLVLSLTILTYSLGAFLCGFGTSLGALLLFRAITGMGVGGEWATGQTLVGETFPARMRARFAGVMQTGAPLGIALAWFLGKLFALAGVVVVVETTNAKLRLFRVPDLLSAAFILAALALLSGFLFQ